MKFRALIVTVATLFLAFIFAGGMKEAGQSIKYPANAIMSINAYNGNNPTEMLNKIDQLAKQSKIIIYKDFVSDSGETKGAELGAKQAHICRRFQLLGIII
ncbi:MAG: hypothetical protein LBV19_07295 [Streptococcaceae bacterium]|jgi:hypothetical protein|nr:hypothetical protein [Streptococcaceae bacterium]